MIQNATAHLVRISFHFEISYTLLLGQLGSGTCSWVCIELADKVMVYVSFSVTLRTRDDPWNIGLTPYGK